MRSRLSGFFVFRTNFSIRESRKQKRPVSANSLAVKFEVPDEENARSVFIQHSWTTINEKMTVAKRVMARGEW